MLQKSSTVSKDRMGMTRSSQSRCWSGCRNHNVQLFCSGCLMYPSPDSASCCFSSRLRPSAFSTSSRADESTPAAASRSGATSADDFCCVEWSITNAISGGGKCTEKNLRATSAEAICCFFAIDTRGQRLLRFVRCKFLLITSNYCHFHKIFSITVLRVLDTFRFGLPPSAQLQHQPLCLTSGYSVKCENKREFYNQRVQFRFLTATKEMSNRQ